MTYADFRVSGGEQELREFMTVLATIGLLCSSGSSRRVVVDVDGDGSGNLAFDLLTPDGPQRISFPNDHPMCVAVWHGGDPLPPLSIGE